MKTSRLSHPRAAVGRRRVADDVPIGAVDRDGVINVADVVVVLARWSPS